MEIFTITISGIYRAYFTQIFSLTWCCISACIGAIGIWILIPNPYKIDIRVYQPYILYKQTSRYVWSSIGAFICAIVGGSGHLILLPWLLVVTILIISLCIWDIYYCVVPNWQNLMLLLMSAIKSAFPIYTTLTHSYFIDISIIYNLLLGAGITGLIYILGTMLWRRQLIGEGDIVFCASFSALFGFDTTLISIFWGCVLASIIGCLGRIFTKNTTMMIPLIPYIVGGCGVGVLLGYGYD